MNNVITDDIDVVYYVLQVNGVDVSTRFNDRIEAALQIRNLSEEQQHVATIATVTADGRQVLLG